MPGLALHPRQPAASFASGCHSRAKRESMESEGLLGLVLHPPHRVASVPLESGDSVTYCGPRFGGAMRIAEPFDGLARRLARSRGSDVLKYILEAPLELPHASKAVCLLLKRRKRRSPLKAGFVLFLAESEGFEPSMQFLTAYSLSRGAPSTTRPALRTAPNVTSSLGAGQTSLFRRRLARDRRPCATRAPRVPCISRRPRRKS